MNKQQLCVLLALEVGIVCLVCLGGCMHLRGFDEYSEDEILEKSVIEVLGFGGSPGVDEFSITFFAVDGEVWLLHNDSKKGSFSMEIEPARYLELWEALVSEPSDWMGDYVEPDASRSVVIAIRVSGAERGCMMFLNDDLGRTSKARERLGLIHEAGRKAIMTQ